MTKTRKFIKSTLSYSIGIFGSKVVMFAIVPIYSFFLNPEELGEYDLILISITLFSPLITIQVSDAVYRFLIRENRIDNQKRIISSGIYSVIIGYVFFGVIAGAINQYLNYEHFSNFMILLLASCFFLFFQQVLRGLGRNNLYAYMGVSNAILILGLSAYFLLNLKLGLEGILWAIILSQTLSVLFIFIPSRAWRFISIYSVNGKMQKALLNYSWPLLPNALSWWLIDLGNRYIILFFLGEQFNGIYAVSARFAGIMALINTIFILTWQDFALLDGEAAKVDLNKVSRIFKKFMIFELSSILVLAASSRYIIQWTTDSDYHDAVNYFPILILSSGVSAFCAYLGALYLKEKRTLGLFGTSILGGLVNIIFSILAISEIGLYAVALGSLIGFIVTLTARLFVYKIKFPGITLLMMLFLYGIVLLILCFGSDLVTLVSLVFAIIIFIIMNKSLFLLLLDKASYSKV